MKLYTEKEVIEFTMNMISQYEFGNKDIWNRELLKESFQYVEHIHIPSDDEIKERSLEGDDITGAESYELGAKWVVEQIKQQENGK